MKHNTSDMDYHLESHQAMIVEGEFNDIDIGKEIRLKLSNEESPKFELQELLKHLKYAFLEEGSKLHDIIAANLSNVQK